jgi:dTDP-4-dehydrorhamnose 3,5-epimerase
MKTSPTPLTGVLLVEPKVFSDERGFFYESWNQSRFNDALGQSLHFVQDNHSRSTQGVLRGIHFQRAPHAQGKLVRCVAGRVFDVAVDLRIGSPTLGAWVGYELSADNHRQLWIPAGFGHGFLVLSPSADIIYKTTAPYAPASEGVLRFDDPDIGIEWPEVDCPLLLAPKDAQAPLFKDLPLL